MSEYSFPPPGPADVMLAGNEPGYQDDAHILRARITNHFAAQDSLGSKTNWLYYRYEMYDSTGPAPGESQARKKEVALFMLASRWLNCSATIRLITNVPYENEQDGQWLIEDAMLDQRNNAHFYTGMQNLGDDPTYKRTQLPLFILVNKNLVMSKNAKNITPSKTVKERLMPFDIKRRTTPFGSGKSLADKSYALHRLGNIFSEVVQQEIQPHGSSSGI
ncbi:hypothetical protein BH10PAT3_BH10PAT3_0830 [soil metagenome]